MQSVIIKLAGVLGLALGAALCSTSVSANPIIYNAITDFPVTDAGEVPYYVDMDRQALAINAAQVPFRDRFARAEVVYDGQPGVFQITLVALAERDGEAIYNLLVNDEIVGTATNPEVDQEFAVVRHEFADIELPASAVMALESLANSNERIPENDEFAFARGRWIHLELLGNDAIVSSETTDLALSATISRQAIMVGDAFDISVSVVNAADSAVATGIQVFLQVPVESLEVVDGSVCIGTPTGFQCPLPELAATESFQLTLTLQATAEFSSETINLAVGADQVDRNQSDNTNELVLSASTGEEVVPTDGPADTDTDTDTDTGTDTGTGTGTGTPDSVNESTDEPVDSEQTQAPPRSSSGGGALTQSLAFLCLCLFLRTGCFSRVYRCQR